MATRQWILKQPIHRSEFVRRQRAIAVSGTFEIITPNTRTRYFITEGERIKYNIKCRPSYTYRAQRRATAKFNKKIEKHKIKNQKLLKGLLETMEVA